jgi:hypothetical protein
MKHPKDYFFDKEHIRIIDTCRIIYFISFLVSFGITETGRFLYRPYIYENKINDFGIADSIGNSGGIIVQIFFGLAILNSTKKKGGRLIIFFSIGYIFYEIVQLFFSNAVFDWKDIYGTLVGGTIGLFWFLAIQKLFGNKIIHKF